jgi:hypothetical protein
VPAGAPRTCATTTGNPASISICFTVGGAPLAAPTVFNSLSGQLVFTPETVAGPDGHLRSYTGTWGVASTGDTVCYDWTTAAACTGFPLPATHPTANGGVTRDYGYAFDPLPVRAR